jgi:hypothetical protein
MKPQYANLRNSTTLGKIFGSPEFEPLANSFFGSFLGFRFQTIDYSSLKSSRFFIPKGAFDDDLEIIGVDFSGNKHLFYIHFLEMHAGLTDGYFEITPEKWRNLKYHAQNESFRYFDCQSVRHICFFSFDFSVNKSHFSSRKYSFDEKPYIVQFDCYELNKFQSDFSEQNIWLDVIKNGPESLKNKGKTPLISLFQKLFNLKKWNEDDKWWYDSGQKYLSTRRADSIARYRENKYPLDERFLETSATSVKWNWAFLEKQLGQIPRKVQPNEIDMSYFEDNLPKLAFDLFRRWTKNAQEKYPDKDFTIVDERLLLKDVEQQIRESTIALFNDDDLYQTEPTQAVGVSMVNFLRGHIEGCLGRHWFTEYIYKTTDEYKTTMALRSLSIYLDLEDVMRIQLDHIYTKVMKEKVNLSNPNLDIKKYDLKALDGKIVEQNDAQSTVQTVIRNLLNDQIKKMFGMKADDMNLHVSDFITAQTAQSHIKANWNLFL